MPLRPSISACSQDPQLAQLGVQFLSDAAAASDRKSFRLRALEQMVVLAGARSVALLRGARGRWRTLAQTPAAGAIPEDLAATAVDREEPVQQGAWLALPLSPQRASDVLLLERPDRTDEQRLRGMAQLFEVADDLVVDQSRNRQRIQRLEAILEIAASWRQTLEMDELLRQMAEASTRLLAAERASIFLWDRPNKLLIGRPALGVEGGELRLAEDTGVVGQVVRTGQPRRVDADEKGQIDRKVDKQLDFQTRSLLCVPLVASNGELFGAFETINKREGNFTDDDEAALTELAAHAAVALESTQQYEQLLRTRNQMADQAAEGVELIGNSPALEALRSTVRRVAHTDLAILILGENGTGKEVIAQLVHYLSERRNEPLVAVNCAAITETLLESELFGHEKGAFTDARETRVGKFELASGGTLFLDEIGDLSLGGQAKLLRVLEEKVVVRVGGSTPIHTDARVIAATNQNLGEMVREKRFREDLYFRLNVVTLELPPLRERGDDILLLAKHFLRDFCLKARRKPPQFTAKARNRLLGHSWPGNVRELRNLMERLAYLSTEDKVDAEDLAFIFSPEAEGAGLLASDAPLNDATRLFQAEYIRRHIDACRGNMTETARRLGLHRSNLYRKMRQLDMEEPRE